MHCTSEYIHKYAAKYYISAYAHFMICRHKHYCRVPTQLQGIQYEKYPKLNIRTLLLIFVLLNLHRDTCVYWVVIHI